MKITRLESKEFDLLFSFESDNPIVRVAIGTHINGIGYISDFVNTFIPSGHKTNIRFLKNSMSDCGKPLDGDISGAAFMFAVDSGKEITLFRVA